MRDRPMRMVSFRQILDAKLMHEVKQFARAQFLRVTEQRQSR
jgi:hypothetical protein